MARTPTGDGDTESEHGEPAIDSNGYVVDGYLVFSPVGNEDEARKQQYTVGGEER